MIVEFLCGQGEDTLAAPEGIELADLITRTAHEIRKARDEAPKNDPVISLSDDRRASGKPRDRHRAEPNPMP